MNKPDSDQSMEDAIAEALAAVDSLDDEAPSEGVSVADEGDEAEQDAAEKAVENKGDEMSLDADLNAAVAQAVESLEASGSDGEQAEAKPAAKPAAKDKDSAQALEELKTRHMRLMADFDNYRKRVQREQATQRLYASENVMRDLLSVVDNIQRAISVTNDDGGAGSLREGITMILNQMLSVLERHGVKPFESVGTPFNPERHEAVARQGHFEYEEDLVCEEMQQGYMLHERLLRAASVVVSAGKLDTVPESASNADGSAES